MTEQEFDATFVEAIDFVDRLHPEKAAQLIKDLIVQACKKEQL